jgi:hypothetical protein
MLPSTKRPRDGSLVPPTGANEMNLHELIIHIEHDLIMKTQDYVIKANGYVDPSGLAPHRFVILTINHRSKGGAIIDTYFIRIDRRPERHLSVFGLMRRGGRVNSSDRVRCCL